MFQGAAPGSTSRSGRFRFVRHGTRWTLQSKHRALRALSRRAVKRERHRCLAAHRLQLSAALHRQRRAERRRMSARPVVGVLALQGSFREHCICLEKAGAQAVEVGPSTSLPKASRAAALSFALAHMLHRSANLSSWLECAGSSSPAAKAPPWRLLRSAGVWCATSAARCAGSQQGN